MKKINYDDLNIGKMLGYGSFGDVYKCTYDNKTYAYKNFYEKDYLNGKKRKLDSICKNVDEKNLIIPKFWVEDKNVNGYLTQFYNHKNILRATTNYTTEKKIKLLKNIKKTINIMHKNKVIHADLNLGNILVNNTCAKIIDFDNCSYNFSEIKIDEINDYSNDFIKFYNLCPEVDIFLFNIITFCILNNTNFYLVRQNIYDKEYKYFDDNEEAKKICNTFFLDDKYPNKDFLIDTVKEIK